MEESDLIVLRIPAEFKDEFLKLWNSLAEMQDCTSQLSAGDIAVASRGDAVNIMQAIVPLVQVSAPIVTGMLGYIIARRGEVEIVKNGNTYRFKSINKDDMKAIVDMFSSI
ncbi:hypothetical protein [Methylocystis sp. SC2]|uniref:hypothetical protein n=1 Tax=Methylocystis sp. (strain SC2) TaxID=187303 RepID=UPI0005A54675|nr:hypothetical protein [Methylocystis sp. SC2]